ncbi:MAG: hypothetical protein ACE5JS_03530 [Nitrospinota bacterium]
MVSFRFNCREVRIDADHELSLLRALPERLNLVGTKQAYKEGLCGRCTLFGGKPKTSL